MAYNVFDPIKLLGNKNLDDIIYKNLHPSVKKLDLGFGIDQNNIKGVSDFDLFSVYTPPSVIPLRNVSTNHLWSNNDKTFQAITNKYKVLDQISVKPVLNTERRFFTIDPTKMPTLAKEDNTHLRGLTAKYYGIPSQPDIKIETAAVNEIHLNTKTGKLEPVTAKQIQAANARAEETEYQADFEEELNNFRETVRARSRTIAPEFAAATASIRADEEIRDDKEERRRARERARNAVVVKPAIRVGVVTRSRGGAAAAGGGPAPNQNF